MRWRGRRSERVTRVEDRRGQSAGGIPGLPFPIGKRGAGVGGLGLVALVLGLLFGVVLPGGSGFDIGVPQLPGATQPASGDGLGDAPDPDAELKEFVRFVVDDAQVFWRDRFAAAGREYETAGLVVFSDATVSGCGPASSATGPFYCPADSKVYIDLGFYRELERRFDAPGDFAQAYVIAHEIGHHVQNLLGVNGEVQRLSREQPDQANELSIRLELQADCYAGVWAYSTFERGLLESGDLEEGLGAAAAVGDDRIQEKARGRIDRESWTHGSSEQRTRWFDKGYKSGDPSACDTFGGAG